ncbi:MAG: AAA-like domain-containing protein [Limnospira sp.]
MIYQVGGSLQNDALSYVERKADYSLHEALRRGEFCYVLNSRQMGKSSLLVRTRHKLQSEGYRCATLDLTMIGGENITPLQWYKGIIADLRRGFRLSRKFNLKTWWKEAENISFLQRLSYFISEILLSAISEGNIVIFIDEIDSILSLDFPVDDFFALIRFCYNQRATDPKFNRLTFAIFGVATPSDLIQDHTRTPFNIGTAIELTGFGLEEVKPLARGLSVELGDKKAIIKEILYWTNGQPFLTQKICQIIGKMSQNKLHEKVNIPSGAEKILIEILVRNEIINDWQSQDEPEHLKTIRDRLLYNPRRTSRLLGIYQQILQYQSIKFDNSREQSELILSGLVIKVGGEIKVKNRIYEEVFNQEWLAQQLSSIRPYSQTFDSWIISGQKDKSRLLRGQALKDAQMWAMGKSLSDLDYQFLARSEEQDRIEAQTALEAARTKEVEARLVEEHKRLEAERQKLLQEQKAAKLQQLLLAVVTVALVVSSGMGIFARWQYRQARISEIMALASSSKGLFASHNRLDAMVEAIKARRRMESLNRVDSKIAEPVETALRQGIYGINEMNRFIGHKGSILATDITSDGTLIATGGQDKTVKIWRSDGQLLQTLEHSGTVFRVAFSPDGKSLVSGSLDGTVKLWSVEGQLLQNIRGHQAPVWGVDFSPNGQMIASSSSDRTAKIWGLDGTLLATLNDHENAVWNVAFDANSQIVATAGVDGLVKLWTVDGQFLTPLEGHQSSVWDVAFCEKTNLLLSGSADRTAKLWRTDGTLVKTFQAEDVILGVDCSKNGEFIAAGGNDNVVKIWRTDGTLVRTLRKHEGVIRDVALTADGLMATSASDDGIAKLWKRETQLLKRLYGHEDTIWDLAIHPRGQFIASIGDSYLMVWTIDGKRVQKINSSSPGTRAVDWDLDGRTIAVGNNGFTVELFDVIMAPKLRVQLEKILTGHQASVYAVAISPDHKLIASGGDDQTIKLWSRQGQLLNSFVAHQERIWDLTFTPDGQYIASSSEDGQVKLWTREGSLMTTIPHQNSVSGIAIAPQGNLIVSASRDDLLRFWTLDGKLLKTVQTESRGLTRVAFSPDGKMIATGGGDKMVKLWNLEGELLRTLPGHESMVISLDFTPDGQFIVSGGDDRTVIIWDLEKIDTLDELEYACDWVRDYLRTNVEVEGSDRNLCKNVGN